MERRSRHRSRKYRHYTVIASLVVIILVVAGAGVGIKVHHDVQQRKVDRVLKVKAEKAEATAFKTFNAENVAKAKKLVNKLDAADKKELTPKLEQLETYMTSVKAAQTALTDYQTAKTDASYQKVTTSINNLKASSLKDQKASLENELGKVKVQVDNEKAAAEAKALTEKYKDKKIVALTFDDGPNPETTPMLLQELKAADVHATFFALGKNAQANQSIIKQEAAQGNVVASHTWDHKDLVTLTAAQQKQEIMSAHDLINKITGQDVNIYRPPYGAYNKTTLAATPLSPIIWGVDTEDWKLVGNTAGVVQNAVTHAHDGAIILIHDIHPWSVAAVPQIISQLKAKGFTFVTVPELLGAREGGIKAQTAYTGF